MNSSPRTHKAAAAGRKAVQRLLPAGFVRLIDLAASNGNEAGVWAMAGALGAMGSDLRGCYSRAGSEVRELIVGLQRWFLRGEAWPDQAKELNPYRSWLEEATRGEEGGERRHAFIHWLEIANERLTMRGYARPDDRLRHAKRLIARPLKAVGIECDDQIAERLLAFADLTDARRQAELGRNRIEPHRGEGFGGFYGLTDEVLAPGEQAIRAAAQSLLEEALKAEGRWREILDQLRSPLEQMAGGQNPGAEWIWPDSAPKRGWLRWFKR